MNEKGEAIRHNKARKINIGLGHDETHTDFDLKIMKKKYTQN